MSHAFEKYDYYTATDFTNVLANTVIACARFNIDCWLARAGHNYFLPWPRTKIGPVISAGRGWIILVRNEVKARWYGKFRELKSSVIKTE